MCYVYIVNKCLLYNSLSSYDIFAVAMYKVSFSISVIFYTCLVLKMCHDYGEMYYNKLVKIL